MLEGNHDEKWALVETLKEGTNTSRLTATCTEARSNEASYTMLRTPGGTLLRRGRRIKSFKFINLTAMKSPTKVQQQHKNSANDLKRIVFVKTNDPILLAVSYENAQPEIPASIYAFPKRIYDEYCLYIKVPNLRLVCASKLADANDANLLMQKRPRVNS